MNNKINFQKVKNHVSGLLILCTLKKCFLHSLSLTVESTPTPLHPTRKRIATLKEKGTHVREEHYGPVDNV